MEPEKKNPYRVQARCHVCGRGFLARYNVGRRAKICTSPKHVCKSKEINRGGKRKLVTCIEKCCRSKYRRGVAQLNMDSAIDPRKVLSDDEYRNVVRRSYNYRDPYGIAVRFIAMTGCRLGESELVRKEDFLFAPGPLSTVRILTLKRDGRPPRSVHLPTAHKITKELKKWVAALKRDALAFPFDRRKLQWYFEEMLEGVKDDRQGLVHILRHTRASQLVAAGAALNYVRQQLGWANLEMAKIYTHTSENEISNVLSKI